MNSVLRVEAWAKQFLLSLTISTSHSLDSVHSQILNDFMFHLFH